MRNNIVEVGSLFQCFLASFRGASLNNKNRQNILIETHPFAPPPDPLIFPRYRHRANGHVETFDRIRGKLQSPPQKERTPFSKPI